jgi:hypothetical protein
MLLPGSRQHVSHRDTHYGEGGAERSNGFAEAIHRHAAVAWSGGHPFHKGMIDRAQLGDQAMEGVDVGLVAITASLGHKHVD